MSVCLTVAGGLAHGLVRLYFYKRTLGGAIDLPIFACHHTSTATFLYSGTFVFFLSGRGCECVARANSLLRLELLHFDSAQQPRIAKWMRSRLRKTGLSDVIWNRCLNLGDLGLLKENLFRWSVLFHCGDKAIFLGKVSWGKNWI